MLLKRKITMTNQKTNFKHNPDPEELFKKWEKNMTQASSPKEEFLALTHLKEIKNGVVEYVSYLVDAPKKTSEDSNKDENFITREHETLLVAHSLVHSKIIDRTFIHSEDLHQYTVSVKDVISSINKMAKNDEKSAEIFDFLTENLEYLQKNHTCPYIVLHSMCYTMEILIFALIEKFLRIICTDKSNEMPKENSDNVKKKEKKRKKDLSQMSLGDLLWDKRIEEIFTQTHLTNLRYFLSTCSQAGLDLRNDFIHCKDFDIDKLIPDFVYNLLYLFTDVLNTAHLYFLSKQEQQ